MNEEDWFAELYERSFRKLVLAAYALTNDLGEAEEIAQEAFAVAYTRQSRLAAADSPEAWVRTVAVNLARRRLRRRTMLDRILRRHHDEPEPPADATSEHLDLHDAIRTLPDEQRVVVVLHYLADLPVDEISSIVDCPIGTVKSRLSRARTALATQLRTEVDHV
jgi:RNA polymerase sigma-70 factor, ECF subfamily